MQRFFEPLRSVSNLPNAVFAAFFVHRALISSVISPDFGPTSSHLSLFFSPPGHKSLNSADRPVSPPPLHTLFHPSLPLTIALGTRRFWTPIKRQGSSAGKKSSRISLLMAIGRNYRLLGVKMNISVIVSPGGCSRDRDLHSSPFFKRRYTGSTLASLNACSSMTVVVLILGIII